MIEGFHRGYCLGYYPASFLAGNQRFGTNICPFFRAIHDTNDDSSRGSPSPHFTVTLIFSERKLKHLDI